VSTNRLESFSDGVLAVAITLLVLNITPPSPQAPGTLVHKLLAQWPAYAAYVTSFTTIGIIWINHHAMIGRLREADHAILMLNLLLLLTVAVIPFATSLFATYLKQGQGENLAAGIYGGVFLAMAIAFTTLQHQILMRKASLLKSALPLADRRTILLRSVSGIIPYVVATALAAVTPYATLVVTSALAAYYALPIASGVTVTG